MSGRSQTARGLLPTRWVGPAGSGLRVSLGWSPALSAVLRGSFPSELPGPSYRIQNAREVGGSPAPAAPPRGDKAASLRTAVLECTLPRGSEGGQRTTGVWGVMFAPRRSSFTATALWPFPGPVWPKEARKPGCRAAGGCVIWGLVLSSSASLGCGLSLGGGASSAQWRLRKAEEPSLRASRPHVVCVRVHAGHRNPEQTGPHLASSAWPAAGPQRWCPRSEPVTPLPLPRHTSS